MIAEKIIVYIIVFGLSFLKLSTQNNNMRMNKI